MSYIGYFRDIKNRLHKVNITTSDVANVTELVMSGTPFTTEMDNSSDTLYRPVKYQSATVTVRSNDYLSDVYSGTVHGTKVMLYDENENVEWAGYATPNLYSQGYDHSREDVEIQCVDGLATLKNIKYSTTKRAIVSLMYIFNKCLYACGCYTKFYVSSATQLFKSGETAGSEIEMMGILYVSEELFFDEKKDDETDDDVAWTMDKVLEEICQYLGLTCVGDGDCVYFIDYDALKAGYNKYFEYTIGSTITAPTATTTVSFNKTVTGTDISETGTKLSLGDIYNKVTIKCSMRKFENVMPDFFAHAKNITASDPDLSSTSTIAKAQYGEEVNSNQDNGTDTTNNKMLVFIDNLLGGTPLAEFASQLHNAIFVKYYNNPDFKFYNYTGTAHTQSTDLTSLNYTQTKTYHGAFLARYGVNQLLTDPDNVKNLPTLIKSNATTLDKWLAANSISSVSLTGYIVMMNPNDANYIANSAYKDGEIPSEIKNYPYFTTQLSDTTGMFGGSNAHLVISGSLIWHIFSEEPYPIPSGELDLTEGRFAIHDYNTYLVAQLKWGEQYWNGSSWTTTDSVFKIPYFLDGTPGDKKRADKIMFNSLSWINTVSWRIGTSESGICIDMPSTDAIMQGMPQLTLYKPYDPLWWSTKSGDDEGQHYKFSCCFLSKFAIKAIIGDPTFSDSNDDDTKYTNVISANNVSELKEITFKMCTYDNKNPTYSAIAYKTGTAMIFVNKTFNVALQSGEDTWASSDNDGKDGSNGLRQEEHLIYRLYNQYQTPAMKLDINLRTGNKPYGLYTAFNKTFIVDSINKDYRFCKETVKLIEKK